MKTARALTRELVVLAAVVILGTSTTVLDLTIVNVAVPTLGRELDASVAAIQWVMTAYMLAFASMIPISGWACERFGAKRVWLAALLVFVLGSGLAGAAWSLGSLVAFRVLQGLGAGMILPVGQTILAQAAGPRRMGRVMSLFGVPMLLVPVVAPVLGGAILEGASWRWVFFLNLPVGAAAIGAAVRLLPDAPPQACRPLDVRGLALLSPGIALFLYGLVEAGSARTGITVAGAVLIALFVVHARRLGRAALIDLGLFGRRAFAAAAATNLLLGVALFGSLLLLPLYYQLVRRESALDVGLLLIPQAVGAAVAMPLAGFVTDRRGARLVVTAGLLVALAGTLAFTQLGPATPYPLLAGALFVLGMGIGSTIMPSMAAAFQRVTREETPGATSALHTVQRVAGALGTALLAIVLQRQTGAGAAGLDGLAALARQPGGAADLAGAFAATFWVPVALIAVAVVPALLLPGGSPEDVEARAQARQPNRKEVAA